LLVVVRASGGSTNDMASVSSSLDGAFTLLSDVANASIRLKVYVLPNASAGTHTVTGTAVEGAKTFRWALLEYDDVPSSGVIDDYDSAAFTTTTTPAASAITTTDTDCVIVSAVATDLSATTIAPATGETERQEVNERFQVQDEAAATAGSYAASWTLGATQPGIWAILALAPGGATKYLKLLTHADAQSKTGVAGVVFAAPSGSDLTGAKIGEFTAQAFEATLEGGEAVLLVPVADFGGGSLTTSDTPRVEVRYDDAGTIKGTAIVPATVVEL
jgi:hypothetical protein